jgi:predicted metal-dependent peptidase
MRAVDSGHDGLATRVSAARSRLILDRPFLGALVLRLPVEFSEKAWCPTTATDARKIYINKSYLDGLTLSQIEFALAHEALHCGLAHFARRQHREKKRWDIACDFAVNALLIADGLSPVPDALHMKEFLGRSAEEIYPLIEDQMDQMPHDHHLYDSDPVTSSDDRPSQVDDFSDRDQEAARDMPPTLNADERARLAQQWQERLAGAAQQAMQTGRLGAAIARMLEQFLTPAVPWRSVLARYMRVRARDDFDYSRPGRREGEAILPALRSAQINVTVAIDTSGSISASEISEFVSEIDALKGQVSARVTLLACDCELSPDSPRVFDPWEAVSLPESLSGGGGTDFSPVFKWVDNQDAAPDLLIYFTDGKGRFPSDTPLYPVVWLIKGQEAPPWGERVQLN